MAKDKKKIMCGGLAFSDKEDVEMLHQYAKEGWILKEFKGMHYHLYKEEPRDIIFDYDIMKLSDEEETEYLGMLEMHGWHLIPSSKSNKGIYFFWADNGTKRVHTDRTIEADRYKPILKTAIYGVLISILGLLCSIFLLSGNIQRILLVISAGLMGGTSVLIAGSLFRTQQKRLYIHIRFKTALILCMTSLVIFVLNYFSIVIPNLFLIRIFSLMGIIFFGFYTMIEYRQYRDHTEV